MKTWSMPASAGKKETIPCVYCGGNFFKPALDCGDFKYVRCNNCSLVQMNPQPLKEEIFSRYKNIYGNDYLSYEIKNEAAFFKLQQLALEDAGFYKFEKKLFSNKSNNCNVLDVGCATGVLLASLSEHGWQTTGVEISPSATYAKEKRGLDVRNTPLEEINFPKESFDAVIASHLIEHLNNPKSFLLETWRILKHGCPVFITTPNIAGLQAKIYKENWRSAIFDHLYLFSVRTLKMMLKKTGFKVEAVSTWGGLGAGLAPAWIKKPMDFFAKRFGFGDVMIIRAVKCRQQLSAEKNHFSTQFG